MDSVRKRILQHIVLAPSVVLPIVAGASALLLAWAAGGGVILPTVGVISILGGVGWLATRYLFRADAITEQVLAQWRQKEKQEEDRMLNELMRDLFKDRDHRTEDYLILLRTLREQFEELTEHPGIAIRSQEIVQKVRQLFAAAVYQLRQSLKLWELAERLVGEERNDIANQREAVLAEVKQSIDHLKAATDQFREYTLREKQSDLSELGKDLDESLRIAKRVEERMREFDWKPNYEQEFDPKEKE